MVNKDGMVLIFSDEYISHVQGKMLTIIEALGLPKSQEEATKSLVRNAMWVDMHDGYCVPKTEEEWGDFSYQKGTFEGKAI